jgi:hypothetical protein
MSGVYPEKWMSKVGRIVSHINATVANLNRSLACEALESTCTTAVIVPVEATHAFVNAALRRSFFHSAFGSFLCRDHVAIRLLSLVHQSSTAIHLFQNYDHEKNKHIVLFTATRTLLGQFYNCPGGCAFCR